MSDAAITLEHVVAAVKVAVEPIEARLGELEKARPFPEGELIQGEPMVGFSDVEFRLAKLETKSRNVFLRIHDKLKGWRTIIVATLIGVAPALLDYLGQVDVNGIFGLSPKAGFAVGVVMLLLRLATNRPVPVRKAS